METETKTIELTLDEINLIGEVLTNAKYSGTLEELDILVPMAKGLLIKLTDSVNGLSTTR